jgi:hypothetical protein
MRFTVAKERQQCCEVLFRPVLKQTFIVYDPRYEDLVEWSAD